MSKSKLGFSGVCAIVTVLGLITAITLFIVYETHATQDNKTLELVAVMHRHGDRTPLSFYKNDPYSDVETFWPIGLGQLTLRGKQQLYGVGRLLNQRYLSFISKFTVQTVRVESSDSDRCLMSVGSLLAGMFPPNQDQIWNKDLNWHPIPIHTTPKKKDKMLGLKAPCPRYTQEYNKIMKELEANTTELDKELFKYLTNKTGEKIDTVRQLRRLYSILRVEEGNGLILPEWTKEVYPDKLREKAEFSFSTSTWNTLMKRLKGGPMLDEIVRNFIMKSKDRLKKMKFLIYSGHDSGVVSLWRALGFEERILPNFGATFIFELHKINSEHFVRMMFLNHTSQIQPFELTIPKCPVPCPLELLVNLTEATRPVDWDEECKSI